MVVVDHINRSWTGNEIWAGKIFAQVDSTDAFQNEQWNQKTVVSHYTWSIFGLCETRWSTQSTACQISQHTQRNKRFASVGSTFFLWFHVRRSKRFDFSHVEFCLFFLLFGSPARMLDSTISFVHQRQIRQLQLHVHNIRIDCTNNHQNSTWKGEKQYRQSLETEKSGGTLNRVVHTTVQYTVL